jgi:hypothetical protein
MGVNVKFQIGRLSIDGASRADGARVGDALRSRLASLVMCNPPLHAFHINRLDVGTLPRGASPEQAGDYLAEQIFRSLKGSRNV